MPKYVNWTAHGVFLMGLFIAGVAVIGGAVAWFLIKKLRTKLKMGRTVPATFEAREHILNTVYFPQMHVQSTRNLPVEYNLLTCRDKAGKLLRFAVDPNAWCGWNEGAEGKLTYNGSQFIGFETK